MVARLLLSLLMMAACVTVHATGSVAALHRLGRSVAAGDRRFWPATGLLIRLAMWFIAMHLVEVALWASLYVVSGSLPDLHVALYFSAVTYTTVGYGDVVLPDPWRLLGGVEALTGILMCGWSTGAFFSVVSRLAPPRPAAESDAAAARSRAVP